MEENRARDLPSLCFFKTVFVVLPQGHLDLHPLFANVENAHAEKKELLFSSPAMSG